MVHNTCYLSCKKNEKRFKNGKVFMELWEVFDNNINILLLNKLKSYDVFKNGLKLMYKTFLFHIIIFKLAFHKANFGLILFNLLANNFMFFSLKHF